MFCNILLNFSAAMPLKIYHESGASRPLVRQKHKTKDMKDLKGTKTEANLKQAFAGESEACNRYTFFSSKAKKDGYEQIAAIFAETAHNEQQHAKIWFKILQGGEILDTRINLAEAAAGEHYEWSDMYEKMARDAEGEESSAIVVSRDGDCIWVCRNCGHVVIGPKAPAVCPVCNHPQAFFEIQADNY